MNLYESFDAWAGHVLLSDLSLDPYLTVQSLLKALSIPLYCHFLTFLQVKERPT